MGDLSTRCYAQVSIKTNQTQEFHDEILSLFMLFLCSAAQTLSGSIYYHYFEKIIVEKPDFPLILLILQKY